MALKTQHPSLPVEIWGQILSYLDTYTLWTACRRISRTLRREAESEIARNRLADLQIVWDCAIWDDEEETWSSPYWETTKFLRLSGDRSRAYFSLRAGYRTPVKALEVVPCSPRDRIHLDVLEFYEERVQSLYDHYMEDLTFLVLWTRYRDKSVATVNPSISNIPSMTFSSDRFMLSFDWKELLVRFEEDDRPSS